MKLTYYIQRGDNYEGFLTYSVPENLNEDEVYARQLCEYFVVKGKEYKLLSNEMAGKEEVLVVEEKGDARRFSDEKNYKGQGVHIEFREYRESGDMRLIRAMPLATHWEVIRYLLKDVIDIPEIGQFLRDSTEIDEDRGVYVIYLGKMVL
ncbi:RNA helicase [Fictibacillus aquaticus]|uniref:RNA helicase n=1 Tax=Fictibacillus aquaticus TaxID=2021314 RepID=UPI001F0B1FA2|nr:RNA helicase [Fictibacillus aquaticus]